MAAIIEGERSGETVLGGHRVKDQTANDAKYTNGFRKRILSFGGASVLASRLVSNGIKFAHQFFEINTLMIGQKIGNRRWKRGASSNVVFSRYVSFLNDKSNFIVVDGTNFYWFVWLKS